MDLRLVAWARSVKSRHGGKAEPPLWLFTDAVRLPDPLAAVRCLPRGLAGVVFRPEGVPDRRVLGRALAAMCRDRRLALVVAGDWRLAAGLGVGVHLRGGRGPAGMKRGMARTSSAHSGLELHRAARTGASLVFLSPAFPTESHRGASGLGAVRWSGLANRSPVAVAALGGISGDTIRQLARRACAGAGAIGALVA